MSDWKDVEWEDCPFCGGLVKGLTDSKNSGYFYDSDEIKCVECKEVGSFVFDEDTSFISWENQ